MDKARKGMEVKVDDTTLFITTEPIPLETDADGVVRVGGTRVTLDTIVAAFTKGATAEEILKPTRPLQRMTVKGEWHGNNCAKNSNLHRG